MNKNLKKSFVAFYFVMFYFNALWVWSWMPGYFIYLILIVIVFMYMISYFYKHEKMTISNILKIIFVTCCFVIFFTFEQLFIMLYLYGFEQCGYLEKAGLVTSGLGDLSWEEKLYWKFIFSLHYPIYIYIFFKPFVNHLDKSIRKIKEEKPLTKS